MSTRLSKTEHMAYLQRQADGEQWRPDAVIKIAFDETWDITAHPVEKGVTVSDHVQRQPMGISIDVVLTENTTKPAAGGRTHVKDLLDWLRDTANLDNPLVDVVTTRDGVHTSYAIKSVPRTYDNVARLAFTLQLQEVRVAVASTVLISVEDIDATDTSTASGAPDEVDVGEQATTSTDTDSAAEESDQSWLSSLLDAA